MKVMKNNYLGARFANTNIRDANSKEDTCEMHACLRYTMWICRWVGCFPVEGLTKPTMSRIRYNLKGFYLIYFAVSFVIGIVSVTLLAFWVFDNELSILVVSDFIFYTTGFISMVQMAWLAKQWPVFLTKVMEIEQQLREIRTSNKTHHYCNAMSYSILIIALVEHLLSLAYGITLAVQCTKVETVTSSIEKYFTYNMAYYFNHVPYNHFYGFIFKVVNFQCTFLWSFTDVLAVCFSIYLISYFQDLNEVIYSRQNNLTWAQLRNYYSLIVELVMEVDARLSGFILQSFVTYIFYICLQLYYVLNTTESKRTGCDPDILDRVGKSTVYLTYYIFSFLFLVLRFVVTSILAANVNLVAKRPLTALDAVPSAEYSIDVRRFRLQIEYTPVAMTGLLFSVTRPMLLTVVGCIITYELVMLQLH